MHLTYGHPPLTLCDVPENAVQCSPLIPGSVVLESLMPETVHSAHILAPAGTIERRYVLALALRALQQEAPLIAFAPNDKGGQRIAKELQAFGCDVNETSRAHHRICTTTRPVSLHGIDEAIAAGAMRYDEALGFHTQPGIFSWNRMDEGSALLLQHMPSCSGRGADLGCGLGVLARAALQSPEVTEITLVDSDRRAVEASHRNVIDARVRLLWADITQPIALDPLDFIVMNPPFHDGGIENQTLGQIFITRAAAMLKNGGTCMLVANAHLPYEMVLRAHFSHVTCIAVKAGFKIFTAVK